jgi:hypothetical protein
MGGGEESVQRGAVCILFPAVDCRAICRWRRIPVTVLSHCTSIAKQFFQLLARGGFALVVSGFRRPSPADKLKILAEITGVFFQHRLGLPFAALLGHA